jgi:hypothetical protein
MGTRTAASIAARIVAGAVATAALFAPAFAQDNITDKMNNFLFGSRPQQNTKSDPEAPADLSCPDIEVREGAATLSINAPGGDPGPMNTRYQVSIGQLARECRWQNPMFNIRVGVQGRVLLGPAGVPGQVDLPLRIAIVQEGTDPKPIMSKLIRVSVSIPPGQTGVPFTHVEQDFTFPTPRAAVLERYTIYVGFDPAAEPVKPERKAKKKGPPGKRKQTQR